MARAALLLIPAPSVMMRAASPSPTFRALHGSRGETLQFWMVAWCIGLLGPATAAASAPIHPTLDGCVAHSTVHAGQTAESPVRVNSTEDLESAIKFKADMAIAERDVKCQIQTHAPQQSSKPVDHPDRETVEVR